MLRTLACLLLVLVSNAARAGIALDGSPVGLLQSSGPGGTTITITISTSLTNDVLIVFTQCNGTYVTGVTSTSLGAWTSRENSGSGNSNHISEYYAKAATALTSEALTITTSGTCTFDTAVVFAVNGSTFSSPFDSNVSIPEIGTTSGNPTFSTTSANTMVISSQRFGSTATPTPGSGWTSLYGPTSGFGLSMYEVFSSAQSGTTALTSATDQNGWIVDALVAAGGPTKQAGQFFLSE